MPKPKSPQEAAPLSALDRLPPKQGRFVEELAIDWNAARAAIRAGYAKPSARQQASDLLTKPDIQDAIAELRAKQSLRCQIEADDVIGKLKEIAFGNLGNYHTITEGGEPNLDMSGITRAQWSALKKIKIKRYLDGKGEDARLVLLTEIEMHDPGGSLDKLGKHLGLFKGQGSPADLADVVEKDKAEKVIRKQEALTAIADRFRLALPPPDKKPAPKKAKPKAKSKAA